MAEVKEDADDDGSFAEEVCTFDFAEDEYTLPIPAARTPNKVSSCPIMCREYEGEDYSCYLQDDSDVQPVRNIYQEPTAPVRLRKNRNKSLSVEEANNSLQPEYVMMEGYRENQRRPRDAIKDRVSKWLNTVKGNKSTSNWDAALTFSSKMSNFTYADSKIGLSQTADERLSTFGPESDSGIDVRSVKAHSDMGYQAERPAPPQSTGGWSDSGSSLFVQRQAGNHPSSSSSALGARRRSKSAMNIHDKETSKRGLPRVPSGDFPNEDSTSKMSQGKLSTVWKKLSNTLSRGRKPASMDDRQGNGSSLSYSDIYEDLKF